MAKAKSVEKKVLVEQRKSFYQLSQYEQEEKIIQYRRDGNTVETIIARCTYNCPQDKIAALAKKVKITCESFESFEFAEEIINSDLCKIKNGEEYYVVKPQERIRRLVSYSSLALVFSRNFMYKKCKQLYEKYNPRNPNIYFKENGLNFFNTYTPPRWMAKHFYKEQPFTPLDMPAIYEEFFMHLVNGDKESYDYLIRWLANSLITRNYCYLVTVGRMGIGKGVLYEITALLHGIREDGNNSVHVSGKTFFTSNFQDDLKNKTLLYIDEISKMNVLDYDKLKMLVNNDFRVEEKGKAAKHVDNYMNVMLSSNDIAAIPTPKDDRRLSILTLTDTDLKKLWEDADVDGRVNVLKHPDNIAKLGQFLLTKVDLKVYNMHTTFKSKSQMKKIESTALEDWQDYFLFTYCKDKAGETIPLREVVREVKEGFNNRNIRLSMREFMALKDKFPGFYVKRAVERVDGTFGETGLGFKELDKQPKREDFNLEVIDTE